MNKEMQQVIRAMNGVHKEISYYDESFLLKSLEKRLAATSCATIADYCQYLSVHGGEAAEAAVKGGAAEAAVKSGKVKGKRLIGGLVA